MNDTTLSNGIQEVLDIDIETFEERVSDEAAVLEREVEQGTFNNPQANIGFEYEFYGVDKEEFSLKRVPRILLDLIGFEKELGLHNAEMNTSPQPLNQFGLVCQEKEVQARLQAGLTKTHAEEIHLVSDGLWTIPPVGESSREYLTDSVEKNGLLIATNMSDAVRYHAMANAQYPAEMKIETPHVQLSADTVMPESLTTSIQPHYQVPHAPDIPEYFNYALRIAGPILALGVNSPFFPPDLYEDVDPSKILADHWMENRISVFETALNADNESAKVAFPNDVNSVGAAINQIVEDETIVPMPIESGTWFGGKFAHFDIKRGSFWRWIRPVFDGNTKGEANARIEFRPIPAQPTVRDSIAFLAIFAGLMESLPTRDHPVDSLTWDTAQDNFYRAMRNGLDADLSWITTEGNKTSDPETLYADIFECAHSGLTTSGLSRTEADTYLDPLRYRVSQHVTPGQWKHNQVIDRIEQGASLSDAIHGMQRAYIHQQSNTLIDDSFINWEHI